MGLALAEGLGTEGFVFDTELAAYVLDPTESGYDLGKLTKRYLGAELPEARAALELMAPMRAKLAENGAEKARRPRPAGAPTPTSWKSS